MASLAEGLPNEIDRVRILQDEFKALRRLPNVIVEPQIAMMEGAIQTATRALASGDVIAMIRAYEHLKTYEG